MAWRPRDARTGGASADDLRGVRSAAACAGGSSAADDQALGRRCVGGDERNFNRAYGTTGKPGIPPEQLLKSLPLQALYSIPSERKLVEAIQWNVLYRWFLDLRMEQDAWTQEAFSMNRERFERHDPYRRFFDRVVAKAIHRGLVSEDHFTCDGTLIRSLASHKSLKPIGVTADRTPKDDVGEGDASSGGRSRDESVNWRGERRTNATHRSTTDPDARLARKGNVREAHRCHSGHVLMENRNGLCLNLAVDRADGHAERRNALQILRQVERRHGLTPRTSGFDAGYKAGEFLVEVKGHGIVPHAPIGDDPIRGEAPPAQASRRARRRMKTIGYSLSQRVRQRCEPIIGWAKTVAGLAPTRFIGHVRIENSALMCGAAYNLLRMTRLVPV